MATKKSSAPKAQCAPVEFTGDQWHVREIKGSETYWPGTTWVKQRLIHWELVWGKLVRETNGGTKVVGDAYHSLHGPTAERSIRAFAERLNRDKVPPTRAKKCIADGVRAPKDGGKDQMMMDLRFKPTPTAP